MGVSRFGRMPGAGAAAGRGGGGGGAAPAEPEGAAGARGRTYVQMTGEPEAPDPHPRGERRAKAGGPFSGVGSWCTRVGTDGAWAAAMEVNLKLERHRGVESRSATSHDDVVTNVGTIGWYQRWKQPLTDGSWTW